MSTEGSLKAVNRYRQYLTEKGAKPIEQTDVDPTHLNHLLWMCEHLLKNIRDDGRGFAVDKYSRWIGYIQGVLIARGHTTVNEERDVTRPWFTSADYSHKEQPKLVLSPEEIERLNIPR